MQKLTDVTILFTNILQLYALRPSYIKQFTIQFSNK